MSTNSKIKTQKHIDDLLTAVVSFSDPNSFSLTHAPQLSECVLLRNEESLTSIYILSFTLFPLQQVGLT